MTGAVSPARAQTAAPDTTVAPVPVDSAETAAPDTVRTITVEDSLGVPGTLKGQTVDPAATKALENGVERGRGPYASGKKILRWRCSSALIRDRAGVQQAASGLMTGLRRTITERLGSSF
jgi:hypothetical protein